MKILSVTAFAQSVSVLGYKQQNTTLADLKKKNDFIRKILRILRLKGKIGSLA